MEGLPHRRRGESRAAFLILWLALCLSVACDGSTSEAPEVEPAVKAADLEIGGNEAHTGDPLADEIFRVIRDFIELKKSREDREELIARVRKEVDVLKLGDSAKRSAAVTGLVDEIIAQAERYRPSDGTPGEVSGQQRLFVVSQAQSSADRLRSTLRGESVEGSIHVDHDPAPMLAPSIGEVDVPDGFKAVSWKTLASFKYEDGMKIPDAVAALDGQPVGVAGYMMSLGEYQNIRRFLLVESAWACCFGIVPDVNESVEIFLPDSDPGIELVTLPILVTGKLSVQEEREQGYVIGLYKVAAEDVVEVD